MTTTTTTRDILLGAVKYLEDHGWCQGRAFSLDKRACILGAIYAASGGEGRTEYFSSGDYPNGYIEAIDRIRPYTHDGLGMWNDQPGRTKEDVINLLKDVANNLEE